MKKSTKVLSLLLSLALVISCFAGMSVSTVFAAGNSKYSKEEVILHCWNWPVSTIRKNLQKIAESGYTAIQTSPINGIIGSGNNTVTNWYEFYQPTNYSIGNKICTESEFKTLCTEAHALELKVIVDVALNHTTNQKSYVSGITQDYHNQGGISNWDDRKQQTQKDITDMPDLNTNNTTLQSQAKALLQNIIADGADGFRFDAAKHIELPSDDEISGCPTSNYWPTVLNGLGDKFSYGEVLAGQNCPLTGYSKYMNVTGSAYSDTVRNNITKDELNADDLRDYKAGLGGDNLVCWVESHDGYVRGNYGMPKYQVTRAWAALTAQGLNTLYLARPYGSSTSNMEGSNNTYDGGNGDYFDDEVVGANKFHNACKGTGVSNIYNYNNYNKLLVIERGNKGICFINTGSSNVSVSVSTSMPAKTYKDLAHNTSFTVSGNKLSGTVPPGVYPVASGASGSSTSTADYYVKGGFNSWGDTNKMTVSGNLATAAINIPAGTYEFKIANSDDEWFGNDGTIVDTTETSSSIGWEMNSDNNCKLQASGGTYTFTFNKATKYLIITKGGSSETTDVTAATDATPTTAPGGKYTVKFTNNKGWSNVYLYAWNSTTGAKNANWPGVQLTNKTTNDYGEEQFTASIDDSFDGLIFNNGSGTQTVNITNTTRDGSITGYYPSTQTNGKWNVGTWEVQAASTAAPTVAPTTAAPTTVAPTTAQPTTEAPEPTTVAPTTAEPTTEAVEPTTAEPTTAEPTTEAVEPTTTEAATTAINEQRVYFNPGSDWTVDNARFAVKVMGWKYYTEQWFELEEIGNGIYTADVSSDASWASCKFARFDPETSGFDDPWNVSAETGFTNGWLYTINDGEWDNATGVWSEYNPDETEVPTTAEPTTAETNPVENGYTDKNGKTIDLDETMTKQSDDTLLSDIDNTFKNLQLLGVQKKNDTNKNSIRFVSVINSEIVKDAADYGYIVAGAGLVDTARTIVESYKTSGEIPAKHMFSCRNSSNKISGNYGNKDADTKYKYVTFAVNNIGSNAVAAMFYVKDTNGKMYYAPYTNSSGTTYTSCAANWASLK
jgi:alpha-amylase